MTKKIVLVTSIVVGIFFIFKLGFFSHTPFLSVANYIKITFSEIKTEINNFSQTYFHQAKIIKQLKSQNSHLQEENALLDTFASEVVNLSQFKNYSHKLEPKLKAVRAIAYASLPDFNKVWIDFNELNASKIYGLIYNGVTAGIVVEQNANQSLALLNGDNKCSYAVYVGTKEYPGIIFGKRSNLMVVRYVPSWAEIEVGDEVYTSGLDNIFFEGLKVGTVTSVRNSNIYKEVEVKPFYDSLKPDFFYVITKTR